MNREPRLVFGSVAERYDSVRPSYPSALVDEVISLAGGGSALEVGAGTGKATLLFAQRGVAVHAVEPSAEMASIARRRCADFPDVTIEERDFEDWQGDRHAFALVFSAQAWHWVSPELKYVRAREALSDGGLLAAFWNRPDWGRCALRDELAAAYRQAAPDFGADPGPMHPGSEIAPDRWEDWDAEIDAAAGLEHPDVRFYEWSAEYTAQRYAQLIATTHDHILLADETRGALLAAVRDVMDRHGGTFMLPLVTKLCLARAEVETEHA
ncbi:MAG: class I SAM-dependent methyltransferase [Solirubrobacteraceae bacterium]